MRAWSLLLVDSADPTGPRSCAPSPATLVQPVARRRRPAILAAGAGLPATAAPGGALVLEPTVVPVRPLADYAIGGLSSPRRRRRWHPGWPLVCAGSSSPR
jgi:hypothetical protein